MCEHSVRVCEGKSPYRDSMQVNVLYSKVTRVKKKITTLFFLSYKMCSHAWPNWDTHFSYELLLSSSSSSSVPWRHSLAMWYAAIMKGVSDEGKGAFSHHLEFIHAPVCPCVIHLVCCSSREIFLLWCNYHLSFPGFGAKRASLVGIRCFSQYMWIRTV